MNINIESLFSNQNGIAFTWSNNGGEESEIEKMSREEFATLLCKHSDGNYVHLHRHDIGENYIIARDSVQVSEDDFIDAHVSTRDFVKDEIDNNYDYCKECLVKHIQSLVKN